MTKHANPTINIKNIKFGLENLLAQCYLYTVWINVNKNIFKISEDVSKWCIGMSCTHPNNLYEAYINEVYFQIIHTFIIELLISHHNRILLILIPN